ncbi:MAG TPA: hypothetical protein PK218_00535 [Flavobacterium sp.]|nr:hypothetical protein [Flavobacterium sp.]
MKNLFFGIIATVCFTSISFSQSINVNTIGDFHNVQMEKYYEKLKTFTETEGKEKITQSDFKLLFKEVLISVYGNENPSIVNESLEGFDNCFGKTSIEIADLSINKIQSANYKNEELKLFLINTINDCKVLEFEKSKSYFDNKIIEANKKFEDKDLEIALSTLNTGKASFNYWEENYSKWHLLFNDSSTSASRGGAVRAGRAIGAADCAGFCGGALWGAMGGTAFLPGVGTVTGALAVGCANGMYASVVAGLGCAFLSLFGG